MILSKLIFFSKILILAFIEKRITTIKLNKMSSENRYICYSCGWMGEGRTIEIKTFDGYGSYCKRCRDKRYVYCEEAGYWYDTYTYLTSIRQTGDEYLNYKTINRKYGNIKNVIDGATKQEIKEAICHFGYRLRYFNKHTKADIIRKIMNMDL